MAWTVPRAWPGETIYILGGGASMRPAHADRLASAGARMVAINEAGLTLAPDADILLFSDRRWYTENRHRLGLYRGPRLVRAGRTQMPTAPGERPVLGIRTDARAAFSEAPDAVAGACTGGRAINLAAHVTGPGGRVALLGFDMRPGRWHRAHPWETPADNYAARFISALRAMAPHLARFGVEVVNATPGSALDCFPIVDPEEVLP